MREFFGCDFDWDYFGATRPQAGCSEIISISVYDNYLLDIQCTKKFQVTWSIAQIKMFFQNHQNLVILNLIFFYFFFISRMTRFWSFWKNISICVMCHITWYLLVKVNAMFSTNQNILMRKIKHWFKIDAVLYAKFPFISKMVLFVVVQ